MKYFRYFKLLLVVIFVSSASDVQGQTLFAKPDTTPDYRGYQHIEECWKAAVRITEINKALLHDTIWWDTIPYFEREETKKKLNFKDDSDKRRPEAAIKAINVCLEKFNADTVKILSGQSATQIIKILLIAHRDKDAERFAQRFLDSLRQESENDSDPTIRKRTRRNYKIGLSSVAGEYRQAKPGRLDVANQHYTQLLSVFKNDGDSLYYSIDVAIDLVFVAERMEDTVAAQAARQLALRLNDSTPEEERKMSYGWTIRLPILANFIAQATRNEALDSIAISNVAYNLWRANTVERRVYGGDIVTKDNKEIQPKKPELTGDYYYIADNVTTPGASVQSKPTYAKKGAVPKSELPIKNSINYIVALPTLCHIETAPRTESDRLFKMSDACLGISADIRAIKRKFPDMEIIGLTNTYGTVGQLGPLTPDQDADTLAKLFLEFHRLPVRLIVENTEAFYLTEPDGRRIDLETPNSQELGLSVKSFYLKRLIDKEGYMIDVSVNGGSEWFKRFYEILKNRPDK